MHIIIHILSGGVVRRMMVIIVPNGARVFFFSLSILYLCDGHTNRLQLFSVLGHMVNKIENMIKLN